MSQTQPIPSDFPALQASTADASLPRVLFVDHTAKLGGGEIAVLNLVRHLDRSRYYPIVLLFSDGPLRNRLQDANVETHLLPISTDVLETRKDSLGLGALLRLKAVLHTLRHAWKVRQFIAEHRIDLVHANSLKADIVGGIAARLAGVPVIWHIRDRIENDYLPRPVVFVFRRLCRLIPDFVIANSAATLRTVALPDNEATETVPSGIERDRIRIVHDGTEPVPSSTNRATERPVVGLIGRLSPWKGQHIFIAAAALVRERFPDARFQIIGSAMFAEDEYEKQIREQVETLGLTDCIEFLGFRDDVAAVVASLDVLVHASTSGEPFGQVVIEGMAAGKPVVATNGGGIPEIVVDGVTGLLVPMSDVPSMATAISRLLQDKLLSRSMGRLGRQRVLEHFTIESTAERVESVYDKILTKSTAERSKLQKFMRSFTRRDATKPTASNQTFVFNQAVVFSLAIAAILGRIILIHTFGQKFPLAATFFPVVFISAWLGGLWLGLESVAVCISLIILFVIEPMGSFRVAESVDHYILTMFAVISVVIIILIEQFHASKRRADRAMLEAVEAEKRSEFLERSVRSLALAPDLPAALTTLAYVFNSRLSDWCMIDLVDNAGLRRALVAHRNPQLDALTTELASFPPHPHIYQRITEALRTGSLEAISRTTDGILFSRSESPARLLAKSLGYASHIIVPLTSADRIIGTITLVRSNSHQAFSKEEVQLAAELGDRTALILEDLGISPGPN